MNVGTLKAVLSIKDPPQSHWVGDGFPVRSLFSYHEGSDVLSPFLLLDYAGPLAFSPTTQRRGVGEHPHRGFETVTVVYQGEVEHRDSSGGGGIIGPGDVQWMTAASGILHEEFHSRDFSRRGGMLEMVQLWINLPARDKMTVPRYQSLRDGDIPSVELPGAAGRVRVIAGEFAANRGPASTFTPIDLWDVRLHAGGGAHFTVPEGRTLMVVVLKGSVLVNDERPAREAQVVYFDRRGRDFLLASREESTVLVLGGEPIPEPVVGYGPFVMNDAAQIRAAVADFNSGRFGRRP